MLCEAPTVPPGDSISMTNARTPGSSRKPSSAFVNAASSSITPRSGTTATRPPERNDVLPTVHQMDRIAPTPKRPSSASKAITVFRLS